MIEKLLKSRNVNGYPGTGPKFTTKFPVVKYLKYYQNYPIPTTYGLGMSMKLRNVIRPQYTSRSM